MGGEWPVFVVPRLEVTMWVTIPEGCRLAKVHYQVVWRWALTGEVRGKRSGKRWLVLRADVLKMARQLRESATAELVPVK